MSEKFKNIKVLHVMNGATHGGISTVVLNYYKYLNKEKFHFDLAMTNTILGQNGNAFRDLGCQVFELPLKSQHPFKFAMRLRKILVTGHYDGIHVHSNLTSFYPLLIACLSGIHIRIAHAHTAMISNNLSGKFKSTLSHILTPMVATKLVACSPDAAYVIFGKINSNTAKNIILNNAIDTRVFAFNLAKRNVIRKKLKIEDKFVLGCVGNLGVEKNHTFALKILCEVIKKQEKSCMLLIGDGPLEKTLKDEAIELGIENSIHFLGKRADVNDLLQAMDVFLMPSLYEGFGIAALEAAASGLPIFLSDTIPNSFSFYSKCMYLPITLKPKEWANEIIRVGRNNNREKVVDTLTDAGYDLSSNIKVFETLYE